MKLETILTGPADLSEIRRYMGYYRLPGAEKQPGESFETDPENGYGDTDALIRKALKLTEGKLENKVLSDRLPLTVCSDEISFGTCHFTSKDLAKRLAGCSEVVLFAATSGFAVDRLMEKYKRTEPALAYAISMVGTEHTEALCDGYCRKLEENLKDEAEAEAEATETGSAALKEKRSVKALTPVMRYSPGYGDLPLTMQKDIFSQLDITKRLGVTLNASMLMTPVKTVTAIVGLKAGSGSTGFIRKTHGIADGQKEQ